MWRKRCDVKTACVLHEDEWLPMTHAIRPPLLSTLALSLSLTHTRALVLPLAHTSRTLSPSQKSSSTYADELIRVAFRDEPARSGIVSIPAPKQMQIKFQINVFSPEEPRSLTYSRPQKMTGFCYPGAKQAAAVDALASRRHAEISVSQVEGNAHRNRTGGGGGDVGLPPL
jgi:hypothetical protein